MASAPKTQFESQPSWREGAVPTSGSRGFEDILSHPGIWRGRGDASPPAVSTGRPALDAILPGGGWPRGALTELFVAHDGIGELSLLSPALVCLIADGLPQAWIAPPCVPYAPALAAAGFDLSRLLIIEPPDPARMSWAVEECLRAEGCGAVLAWMPRATPGVLRRLQLAAAASGACGFLFRRTGADRPSPATLRVKLTPADGGLRVSVFKARGGRPAEVVVSV